MPHYPYPTLRKLIFTEAFDETKVLNWLDRILDFYFEMLSEKKVKVSEKYMKKMHTDRLFRRLDELSRKSKIFNSLRLKKTIEFNDKEYLNIPFIYEKLIRHKVLARCRPPYLSPWTHSDMHFSNIMIDIEHKNFILLDPRGYKKCDYYYDFGKLWHSVNGKYELIAERKFILNDNIFTLEHGKPYMLLDNVKAGLSKMLSKYSIEDKENTMMKTEFNEAVHFSSLVPFLLDYDGLEKRAIVAYYTATKLMNDFYEKWI
jgi:hypothetical protein